MGPTEYLTDRHVLRPGVMAEDVAAFARTFNWPMSESVPRDEDRGVDGLTVWRVPDLVTLYYCEDADFGVPYVVLAGSERRFVEAFAEQARRTLRPWSLPELYEAYDQAPDKQHRSESTLLLGIGAPNAFTEGVFSRIKTSMESDDRDIRWIGLWATTYTGYEEFIPVIADIAKSDPVDWVRERAENVLNAYEAEGGAE